MKVLKYFTCVLVLAALVSCQKHEILYDTRDLDQTDAEFQLHYFEPVQRSAASFYIDSVFVNGVLYSSVNGSGQLASYNAVPGGSAGRFFAVKAGSVEFALWRGGKEIYKKTATLQGGKKQNVFVYDMEQAPIVIENDYPYTPQRTEKATAENWGTDSVATVRFYNFMYEEQGVPYPGKLQYQWRNDVKDADGNWVWHNVGQPVGFGEASERATLIVHKTAVVSQGSQSIYYRILKEDGTILQTVTSGGVMKDYSDYWTATIGRAMTHIWAGVRTTSNPYAYVSQWYNK